MSLELIKSAVSAIIGKPAWGVKRGHQSFLTLEFGQPAPTPGGYVHGQWHLWIQCCHWRIEKEGRVLAGSEDELTLIEETVPELNEKKLEDVRITPPVFDAVFAFEGDLLLKTFAVLSRGYEHWQLFMPGNKVLTVGPGQKASVQNSDEPPRYEEGDHVNG